LGALTTIGQEKPGETRGVALVFGEDAPLPGPFFPSIARSIATAPWLAPTVAGGVVATFPPTDASLLASPSFRRFPISYVASLKEARRRIETLRSLLPRSSLDPPRLSPPRPPGGPPSRTSPPSRRRGGGSKRSARCSPAAASNPPASRRCCSWRRRAST